MNTDKELLKLAFALGYKQASPPPYTKDPPKKPQRTVQPEFSGLGPKGHTAALALSLLSGAGLAGYRNNPKLSFGKNLGRRAGLAAAPLAALGILESYGKYNAAKKQKRFKQEESEFMKWLVDMNKYRYQRNRDQIIDALGI